MSRIMPCPGSYELESKYPDTDRAGTEAEEGTIAHVHAHNELLHPGAISAVQDTEMYYAVALYAETCRGYFVEGLTGVEVPLERIEHRYKFTGTPDFYSWSPECLTIIDFKYGYGWVEARENWQLLLYAVLVWLYHGGDNPGVVMPPKVRLIIVQPRANHPGGPVRKWGFDGVLLRNYYNMFSNMAGSISVGDAQCKSGPHCRYCRAIVDCHTNRRDTSYYVGGAAAPMVTTISDPDLARELEFTKAALDSLQHRYNALEAHATERINGGATVPGYGVKQTWSALKWDAPDPIAAAREMGADIAKEPGPVTPTQAIQRKLLSKEMVELMASRKPGAFKLQRENLAHAKELVRSAG